MAQTSAEWVEEHTLKAMLARAQTLGVTRGVAALCLHEIGDKHHRIVWAVNGEIERDPDPTRENDTGSNYLAIVLAKIAQMESTHQDSGTQERAAKFGEAPYRGGVQTKYPTGWFFAAYSGGTEDQDVEIAAAGKAVVFP